MIESENGARFRVTDTQKQGRRPLRPSRHGRGRRLRAGRGGAALDRRRRGARRSAPTIRRRISCTRRCAQTLGTHVAQKGSLVAPDRLRFDFSHPKPMSEEEIAAVEEMANAVVLQDAPVETRLMDRDSAIAIRRDGAVRREIRRRGARRLDGQGDGGREGRQDLFGRALRRHACRPHRRDRADHARVGEAAVGGRRAPRRGADRRGGAKASRRAGQARARDRRRS